MSAIAASPAGAEIRSITWTDLRAALSAGLSDFRRAPVYGLTFAGVYVAGGFLLWLVGAGALTWTIVLSFGFPLIAPFAAVGLYEVSRRIEAGVPLGWADVAGVLWAERGRQVPWLGAALCLVFLFWSFFAHMSLALFLGKMTLVNVSTSWDTFMTGSGLAMLGFQFAVGGLVALLVFTMTLTAAPMLLDREVDVVTAMIKSFQAVGRNFGVLLVWAALIAVTLVLSMVPAFLGLLIALPVLGHATWHLYRRLIAYPA